MKLKKTKQRKKISNTKGITLTKIIIAIFSIIFFFQLFTTFWIFYLFSYQNKFARVINVAGYQRTLIQMIAKQAFIYGKDATEENLEKLLELAQKFDKNLIALKEGSRELNLPKLKDKNALEKWKICKEKWDEFYSHIKSIKETVQIYFDIFELDKHLDYIEKHNMELLKAAHGLVETLEALSMKKNKQTQIFLVLSLIINLLNYNYKL